MTALAVIPPDHYVGVVESIEPVGAAVRALLEGGAAYSVETPESEGDDLYLDIFATSMRQ